MKNIKKILRSPDDVFKMMISELGSLIDGVNEHTIFLNNQLKLIVIMMICHTILIITMMFILR